MYALFIDTFVSTQLFEDEFRVVKFEPDTHVPVIVSVTPFFVLDTIQLENTQLAPLNTPEHEFAPVVQETVEEPGTADGDVNDTDDGGAAADIIVTEEVSLSALFPFT
jgi:hypothetical protein